VCVDDVAFETKLDAGRHLHERRLRLLVVGGAGQT